MAKVKAAAQKVAPTLAEYLMSKKRKACPICRLPEPLRLAVEEARKKREARGDIIEWLEVVHRRNITADDFAAHVNARHEQ